MIDPKKLNERNLLAKKLVEHKMAINMEDALQKLAMHGDVVKEDDFQLTPGANVPGDLMKEKELSPGKSEDTSSYEEDIYIKLDELENKLKKLNELVNKMKETLNTNFKEIDSRLKVLETKVKNQALASPKAEPKTEQKKEERPKNPRSDPDNYNSGEFAVEKIFNNSGERLTKKK